jgi:2-polyprenyl-6-methoxyphenol hydroxylase-like FAD-dependent oxidoreductase
MKVAIVGSGLAGLKLAGLLSRQTNRIISIIDAGVGQSRYSGMILSNRGRPLLGDVKGQQRLIGRAVHVKDETRILRWTPRESDILFGVSRSQCIAKLTQEASNDRVSLLGGYRVVDVEPDRGMIQCERGESNERIAFGPFDLIVGCDGRNSIVRSKLFQYTATQIPHRWAGARVRFANALQRDCVHVFRLNSGSGFLHAMLCETDSDEFVCTLVLHENDWHSEAMNEVGRFVGMPGSEIPSIFSTPSRLNCIHSSEYHHRDSGRVVLLGDAAHATVPFAGQGMNVALEDANILANLLQDAHDASSIRNAIERFSTLRVDEMEAMHKLGLHQYTLLSKADRSLLRRHQYQYFMSRWLPSLYPSSLYAMINLNTSMSYTQALNAVNNQNRAFNIGRL